LASRRAATTERAAGVPCCTSDGGLAGRGFYDKLALEELGQPITVPPARRR
jgi:hypothetical protein